MHLRFSYKVFAIVILLGVSIFGFTHDVYAKKTLGDATGALKKVSSGSGITEGEIPVVFGDVVKTGIAITGILFFILMVYAGFTWMTAQGKDEQVQKAQKTLIAATIGLVIVIASYAFTSFVQNRLVGDQQSPPPAPADVVGDTPLGCCYDWVAATQAGAFTGGIKVDRGIITETACEQIGTQSVNGDLIVDKWEFNEGWDAAQCSDGL
ncbi:hypothetical protein C0581_04040 [Candidatus Parcubacteria bacterium]|nr:MAG: hypothetical protein C0581_04040 [Candidatus Parcubacteria bacterium]